MPDWVFDIAVGAVIVTVLSGLVGGCAYIVARLLGRWIAWPF